MAGWVGMTGALVLTLTGLYPTVGTHLLTLAHEAGHALIAVLTDGRGIGVRIDRRGGGSTQ